MTLEEKFCTKHQCGPDSFRKYVLWHCMRPRVRVAAFVIRLCNGKYFNADDHFVVGIAEAQSVEQVRREAREYLLAEANQRWLRRVAKVRVSATRVILMAKEFLPERLDDAGERSTH